jgi:PKD repeat protein
MKRNQIWISIAAATLVLAACGGGGGGGTTPANIAPVAIAGGPYSGFTSTAVTFDGSGSSDADGDTLTYSWTFGDGGTATGMTPTHTYLVAGNYTVTLTVSDGQASSVATPTTATIETAVGGISGTGFAKGIISGFGSVIVGTTHYNVAPSTSIIVDDNPSTEDLLEIGDYVDISSSFTDDGQTTTYLATSIVASESLEGPVRIGDPATDPNVSVIDAADIGTLKVLGQTVRVTPATILDNADFGPGGLNELADGDYIEVHGLTRNDGSIDASHVERKANTGAQGLEITGTIDSADPASDSFTIKGLAVTYTLGILQDFGGREPAIGDLVEVKGTPAGLTAGPTLAATSVELKTGTLSGSAGDRAEVEGYIESCSGTPCSSFTVNSVIVNLGTSVVYEPAGFDAGNLANNIKIEAEGSFDGSGVLIARKIEFKTDNNSRIEATVDSNSGTALVLLGVTFNYDGNTAFEDKVNNTPISITQVSAGNYVEAKGDEDASGNNVVQASEVTLDDPPGDGRMIIRGIADSVAGSTVSVLGVDIQVTGATQCKDLDDVAYSGGCAGFLNDLKPGITTVKARGVIFSGGVLTAEEIELEN